MSAEFTISVLIIYYFDVKYKFIFFTSAKNIDKCGLVGGDAGFKLPVPILLLAQFTPVHGQGEVIIE